MADTKLKVNDVPTDTTISRDAIGVYVDRIVTEVTVALDRAQIMLNEYNTSLMSQSDDIKQQLAAMVTHAQSMKQEIGRMEEVIQSMRSEQAKIVGK